MSKKKEPVNNPSPSEATLTTEGKLLSISYPDTGVGLFSNHMIAQNSGTEFHLSFFQIHPPILTGTPEEVNAAVAKLNTVVAKPVVRLIIPAVQVLPIIEVLQKQLLSMQHKPSEQSP